MTVRFLSRAACGLATPNLNHLSRRQDPLEGVTAHWMGSSLPKLADVGRLAYASAAVDAWRRIQIEYLSGNNVNHEVYGDTPYNDAFDDLGRILAGRGHQFVGAHALVHNRNPAFNNVANRVTLGLAYLGNGEPTPAALEAFNAYLYLARFEMGGHPILVLGHRDWVPFGGIATTCPGTIEPHVVAMRPRLAA